MARNQEKAQSMLNRWVNWKLGNEYTEQKRPPHPNMSKTVKSCEHWRRQILKEIAQKVSIIQNASLGEHKIRDINDEINNLISEKTTWELRIIELDGPDYRKRQPKMYDDNGQMILVTPGYKYFGAARELPGVKELFDKSDIKHKARSRAELYEGIDSEYYGFNDEKFETLEKEAEEEARKAFIDEFNKGRDFKKRKTNGAELQEDKDDKKSIIVDPMNIPTLEEVEKILVAKRKEELLKRLSAN
ncbi:pre-mRNA-splicing factor ISY1 [Acrasis kona]|uniref:Pre-mRNA-splicing factor ISY1 n=1 Tax=Acrasis kona TaxID=1008807 RepID=A0AAW2Z5G4_9EUKA